MDKKIYILKGCSFICQNAKQKKSEFIDLKNMKIIISFGKIIIQRLTLIQKQPTDIITNEIFIRSKPKHDIDSFTSTNNGKCWIILLWVKKIIIREHVKRNESKKEIKKSESKILTYIRNKISCIFYVLTHLSNTLLYTIIKFAPNSKLG